MGIARRVEIRILAGFTLLVVGRGKTSHSGPISVSADPVIYLMTVELCFGISVHLFRSWSYSVVHGRRLRLVLMMVLRSVVNMKKERAEYFLKSVAVFS